MSSERRYTEQEIAEIFRQAAADQESAQAQRPHSGGLTLAELERIGKEAGIAPAFISRAAASVGLKRPAPTPTTFLGLPVSAAHTVDLPGPFTEKDWEHLVADLHDHFQAPGKIRRDGSIRQWENGSLKVLVEPIESGYRLRLHALNDALRAGLLGGLVIFGMGLFFILLVAAKGDFAVDLGKTLFASMFAAAGLGGLGLSAARLPGWRKEQQRRMESIAARAAARAAARTGGGASAQTAPEPHLDAHTETEERLLDLGLEADPAEADPAEAEQPGPQQRNQSRN
jgi:hypothetical protein